MKLMAVALGVALTAGATSTSANLTASQFPPRTVRDLIAICSPAQDDPMMTAAVNYCHGFAQGAVIVEQAREARDARKLFCLPSPPPPEGSEIGRFAAWANALPSRLDEPAIDGMFVYLAETYPCPQAAASEPTARGKRRTR